MEAFTTTVVGSMPKAPWLYQVTTLNDGKRDHHGAGGNWRLEGEALAQAQDDAVRVAVHDQERAGVDIISDGEQRRKSYLTHLTMNMEGFDYGQLAEKWIRDGRRKAQVGRCVGPIVRSRPILLDDLRFLQAETTRPVKVTLPGPMTVVDSTHDEHYGDERALAFAWADAMNAEARELDALGVEVIQFDEPVFSRYPHKVVDWGVAALDRCVDGLKATTAVHVCYSYPMPGVPRPIVDSYPTILAALEQCKVQQLALEFEGSGLDPALLKACPSKTVLFGCVFNGTEEAESPKHIAERLLAAARALSPEQIQAAPDCGLVTVSQAAARAKLANMVEGARLARISI
ncbi:MAG: 5-methyltetrahydropteroyltriglutamate--homocysteine methyltransferase [SAR324 cluster bacterium]|nr:5-methyltetrahydropteroyltriglutamate--homocysteine methyltransferase [SAR324 cluster bacterium]